MEYICKPAKLQIYVNTGYKTMAQVKAETGCDAIINGGLFEGFPYKPCRALKVDGVVFLIRNMGHSMYYKVMQSNQFAELPKIYCNSRNINNIYQSMLNSMLK